MKTDDFKETDFGADDKMSMSYHLKQMDEKSVDSVAGELREAYMQLKDLSSRCMIDMEQINKNDARVFYFKPKSVFLEEPEKQRQFRLNFLKKVGQVKQPISKTGLADQLEQEVREAMVERQLSDPGDMRPFLADFFERRLYNLQHKKYKMLTRWAHFALTSSAIDNIGQQGTFIYGRVEYEIENALKRYERLNQIDGYEDIRDGKIQRPQTQEINELAKDDETFVSKALEREDKLTQNDRSRDPISCIRMDDLEVYIRIQTYQNKLFRHIQKFLTKGKWVAQTKNIEILKEFHLMYRDLEQQGFENQIEEVQKIRKRFNNIMIKITDQLHVEMEEILIEDYPAQRINLEKLLSTTKVKTSSTQSKVPVVETIPEKAPMRIQNLIELYCKIEDMSKDFNIIGNVEIDNGFSFSYQVQVYFMTYYQKQIIESTFSRYNNQAKDPQQSKSAQIINTHEQPLDPRAQKHGPSKIDLLYEKFNGDFAHDFSEVQKRSLKTLLMVDFMLLDLKNTNADGNSLPLLKKGKKINEQIPDLQRLFKDIKVIRLKQATWVDGPQLIYPKISEEQHKQNIVFSNNYFADEQLKAILDFIDIDDPSVVNVLYSSISKVYERMSKNEYAINYTTENVQLQSEQMTDTLARQFFNTFHRCLNDNGNENSHKKRMTKQEIEKMRSERPINKDRVVVESTESILRRMPAHLVQCYMTLKHMRMRDNKNKILKIFNFYRSIQKRIVLELREFSGREAVNNHVRQKPPEESYYTDSKATCLDENLTENSNKFKINAKVRTVDEREAELELEEDENIANLISIKRWKYKGQFHNKFLNTCPQPLAIDARSDRPFERVDHISHHGMLRQTKQHICEEAKGFINRLDQYQIDEKLKEIDVIDDFGVTIMYDASISDMVSYETTVLQIGTYYIKKNELDFDFEKFEYPLIDRLEVLDDILQNELEYEFTKSQIVLAYLDALEHSSDPLTQQRLMQIIVDVMAWRPKFDLQRKWYFKTSYIAEIRYLKTLLKILKEVVHLQMENEKKENLQCRDYLNMSYKLADEYAKMSWTDIDVANLKDEIEERQFIQGGMRQNQETVITGQTQNTQSDLKNEISKPPPAPVLNKDPMGKPQKTFAEELGLTAPDQKQNMINQGALSPEVEDLIDQDANFIKTQEGYPHFFRLMQDRLSNVKFSNGTSLYNSNPFGILDFYESLAILPNVQAMITQGESELKNDLKPAGPIQENLMKTAYLEKLYVVLIKIATGNENEYKAQQLIESDLVAGNPDKIMFLVKDMMAGFNKTFKKNINPLLIAKLDLNSINHFSFPDIPQSYFSGPKGDLHDVSFDRNFIETQLKPKTNHSHFFPKLREDDKMINIPPMLLVFCNLIELLKMRESLILNVIDTIELEDYYNYQKKQVNQTSMRTMHNAHLQIDCSMIMDKEKINFVEHGSLLAKIPEIDSGLAIDEICPTLRSNLNFRNPECIQMTALDGGLNNLRVTLHYQLIQKQLLQNAVKTNSIILTPYLKILCEIELLISHGIKMPNGNLDYSKFTIGSKKYVDFDRLKGVKSYINTQVSTQCSLLFAQVNSQKLQIRTTIKKLWNQEKDRLYSLSNSKRLSEHFGNHLPVPINEYTLIRLLHDFKHSLVHVGCRQLQKTICEDAMRIELAHVTHCELKDRINYFGGLPQEYHIFKFEEKHDSEREPPFWQAENLKTKTKVFDDITKKGDSNIPQNLISTIPGLKSILNVQMYLDPKYSKLNINLFDSFKDFYDYKQDDLELLAYRNLTSQFNILNKYPRFMKKIFQKDSKYFLEIAKQHSLPNKMIQLYKNVILLFEFHFTDIRLNINSVDLIEMQNAMDSQRKFWRIDEANSQAQRKINVNSDENTDEIENKTLLIDDDSLSSKIVEQISQKRRTQQQIFDEFVRLQDLFFIFQSKINDKSKSGTYSLDQIIGMIEDQNRVYQLLQFHSVITRLERQFQDLVEDDLDDIRNLLVTLGGVDLTAPYFLNGLVINQQWFDNKSLRYNMPIYQDFGQNKKLIQGLKFQEQLIPANCSLIVSLLETYDENNRGDFFNYTGQLYHKFGILQQDLRLINLFYNRNRQVRNSRLADNIKNNITNIFGSSENGGHLSLDTVSPHNLKLMLQNIIDSKMLKNIYMMLSAGKTMPRYPVQGEFSKDFIDPFNSRIAWKINQYYEAAQYKQKQKDDEKQERIMKSQNQIISESKENTEKEIRKVLNEGVPNVKTNRQVAVEEAARLQLKMACQRSILRDEIEKLYMLSSISAMSNQSAAIQKCLEMTSNKLDKHIGTKQSFCATLFDDVNRHPHLEVVSKLEAIQVFLTKARNRGLPMKTLTSGQGIVFTFKDLNECIHDFTNEMIQFGEKQLKLRTETFQNQIYQLIEVIQYKDLKIDSLKLRCSQVFDNITRVSNALVFEQGNSLVFALDKAMSEVRFYQDHIKEFEDDLTNAIRNEFRLQLQDNRQIISIKDKQIHDMHERIVHTVNDLVVREQLKCNEKIRKLSSWAQSQESYFDKNKKSEKIERSTTLKLDDNQIVSSDDATKVILMLQARLIKQRAFWDMRLQLQKKKYEGKIQFLEQNQSSNKGLWEQMKMEQERQTILKQELGNTQKAAQQNEKLIDKLKEEFQKNAKEKSVLENLQKSKQSKLQELEYKAKRFELSKNLNVEKLVDLLFKQDNQIKELKQSEQHLKNSLKKVEKDFDLKRIEMQRQIDQEMEIKNQGLKKVELLQKQLKNYEGHSNNEWKAKFDEMFKITNSLMAENQILQQKLKRNAAEMMSQTTKTSGHASTFERGNLFMNDSQSVKTDVQNEFVYGDSIIKDHEVTTTNPTQENLPPKNTYDRIKVLQESASNLMNRRKQLQSVNQDLAKIDSKRLLVIPSIQQPYNQSQPHIPHKRSATSLKRYNSREPQQMKR